MIVNENNPNILMFGWEFPPYNSGGLGVACEGLSKALVASGAKLNFVLPYKVPITAKWCNFVFADDTVSFKTATEIMTYTSGYNSHAVDKKLVYSAPASIPIPKRLIDRVRFYASRAPSIADRFAHTVIHAHDWLTYPAGIAAKKVSKKPLVVHVHATEFDRSGGDNVNREIYGIEKEGLQAADAIVTVSGRTKESVIKKYGIDPAKVKVVYNGVEWKQNLFDPNINLTKLKQDGYSIVLFVGRITLQKGPDYFVSMAEKVLKYEPKTYFVVSGSGDMEAQMINSVSKKGLSSNFMFCGFLRDKELDQVYRAADIFVMPSVSEPFGIVPLEAMLSEVPVLVSKESGVSEVLSNALKSHFWDVDDMTDKVVSVLRNKKLKGHLSQNGMREVRTIHWKGAADSLISLYNSLAFN